MKNSTHALIMIGKIGSTFGVRGWLKIFSYTESSVNIFTYHPWLIENNQGEWNPIEVEDTQTQGDRLLVKFANINNPEDARLLTGKFIAIPRDQLPVLKKNEFYWSDLVGLTVINKQGDVLGKVIYLMETGSNDVLVIKNDKEHAIPFIMDSVILNIDLEKQEIHVDWELF
jgi:16S rRNA processing protein RimM